jgi:hypothetical protein
LSLPFPQVVSEQKRPLIFQPDYKPFQARFRRLTTPHCVAPDKLSGFGVNSEPLKKGFGVVNS